MTIDVFQVPLDETHEVTLSGDQIILDGSLYNFFDIYLDRPLTRISNIINKVDGREYFLHFRQDGIGKRAVKFGDWTEHDNLTCDITNVSGTVTITITAGSFDWDTLSSETLGGSDIHMSGWSDNCNNICCVEVTDFDESAGTITLDHPFADCVTNRTGETGVSLNVHNNYYYQDEVKDSWVSTDARDVTIFTAKTSSQDVFILEKKGTLHRRHVISAQARHWNERWDDFIGGNDDGLLQWQEANNGGYINIDSSASDSNHFGVVSLRLNSGITIGRVQMRLGRDAFILDNVKAVMETVQRYKTTAFDQTGITYFHGWGDQNNDPGALSAGVYFEIRSNGDSTGQVWCVTNDGGTKTEHNTDIFIAEDTWYATKIQIAADFSHVHFFLNDHEVAKIGTNLSADRVHCFFGSDYPTGPALTSNKEMEVDMFYVKYRMNSDRI